MEISEKVLYLRNIEAIFEGFAYYCIHNFIYDWPKANWVDRRFFFSSFDFYVFFKADKDCTIRVFRIPLWFLFHFIFALLRLKFGEGHKILCGRFFQILWPSQNIRTLPTLKSDVINGRSLSEVSFDNLKSIVLS